MIIDPKHLKCFDSLKNQAKSVCSYYGLEFMGGYAVPVVHQDDAISRLDDLGAKFEEMKITSLSTTTTLLKSGHVNLLIVILLTKIRDSKG